MKLQTLELFIRKDQDLWDNGDIERLIKRFGSRVIYTETEGITNENFIVHKSRYLIDNDKKILEFMRMKNKEYLYIIDILKEYIDACNVMFWTEEIPLQRLYKILCERITTDEDINTESAESLKLVELVNFIKDKKESIIKVEEEDQNGKE